MTSRLNNPNASLTYGNVNTHIFTEFSTMSKESTQKEVLEAIKNININVGEIVVGDITVESSDTITHTKLDTLNTTVSNKHLNSTTDSVNIGNFPTSTEVSNFPTSTEVSNFPASFQVSNFPTSTEVSNLSEVPLITGFATEETLNDIKTKTDNLTFNNNDGVLELNTFDSQVYTAVGSVTTAINDKHLDSTTDSVTVTGSVSIDTSGLALETTLSELNDKIKSDTVHADAIQVEVKNTSLAVTGDFYPATQPISGSVSITGTPSVSISNTSLVVDPINNSINEAPFDLIINGATVYANSLPTPNPFFADPNGREGWYYDNQSNILNKSNIYWYANPTSGNFQENDMTFGQLSGMYSVITCDYVDNGSLTIPTMGVYSQPTGTNDFIPTFAHSRWVYQLSGANLAKLRKGETILIYTGATRPNVHINLPSYPLQLATQNGDALNTEIIAYMTVNTQATTSKIGYLLQYCGYLNSAIGFNREYSFLNSQKRLTEQNLSSLTFEPVGATNQLYIYSAPITTAIENKHLEFGYDKVDISGSNNVGVTGSVSITGTPSVSVSNASLEVTGTITVANPSLTVTGSVSIPNLNYNTDSVTIVPSGIADVNITNTSVSANITNTSIPVTGTFWQSTQPVSGTVAVSNSFTLDTTSQSTNTKLDTIHADLDGLTFDGSSNLNVNVAAGSITVSSVNIKDSAGNNLNSTSNALNTYLTNTSVDTHCYASSNGTNWHHLSSDSNGQLNVHSKTQDGAGSDITSTNLLNGKLGLDTASSLFGYAGSTRTALTCDIGGKLLISSYTADDLGNGITSSATSTSKNSLDTASSLYVSDGTARTALTATGSSLNANITNASIPVTGTFYQATQPISGIVSSNIRDGSGTSLTSTLNGSKQSLDVNLSNTSIAVSGTFFQSIQPVSLKDGSDNSLTSTDTTATQRSLDTASCLYTTDASTRSALTSTAISSIRALDVNIANSSVPVTFSNTSIGISGTASVSDTTSQGYLNTINNGIGERPASFALGNLINNGSLTSGSFSTEQTFTKGFYGRNTLLFYRDSNTSNTGSISVYSSTTSGTPSNVLLGTFYPISNGTFRQFTGTFNLLPFASLFIRNDSDTTITSVYVSYVNG